MDVLIKWNTMFRISVSSPFRFIACSNVCFISSLQTSGEHANFWKERNDFWVKLPAMCRWHLMDEDTALHNTTQHTPEQSWKDCCKLSFAWRPRKILAPYGGWTSLEVPPWRGKEFRENCTKFFLNDFNFVSFEANSPSSSSSSTIVAFNWSECEILSWI